MAAGGDKYSVILPTYNERKNLPIICWLLERTFREKYGILFLLLVFAAYMYMHMERKKAGSQFFSLAS